VDLREESEQIEEEIVALESRFARFNSFALVDTKGSPQNNIYY